MHLYNAIRTQQTRKANVRAGLIKIYIIGQLITLTNILNATFHKIEASTIQFLNSASTMEQAKNECEKKKTKKNIGFN